jgi:LysR family transcriptional regulator, chromosome initiation inhibitor
MIRRGAPCTATEAGQALQRHAQQLQLLEAEALAPFGLDDAMAPAAALPLAIAVNADSLATWFLPALAVLGARATFDLLVEDQDHSHELLRQGRVLAAVTAEPQPVQGCAVRRLGALRYRAVASPAFAARHFPAGPDADSLAAAPCCVFNAKDRLQERFMRQITRRRLACRSSSADSTTSSAPIRPSSTCQARGRANPAPASARRSPAP